MDKYRLKLVFIVFASLIIIVSIIIAIPFNSTTLPAKMVVSEIFSGIGGLKKRFILDSNRKNNEILLYEYLNTNYGIALTKTFTIIDATAYDDSNQVYNIETPFFENGFRVEISNNKHKVVYNSFYSTLSRDSKFQHLYSEWVKKQVGIEDENVELDLRYGDIDFSKIKSLNETYDEIFENCSYTLRGIEISNIENRDKYRVFNEYRNKYYDKLNKDYNNTFSLSFINGNKGYIGIVDYINIGKQDYYLKELRIGQHKSIKILCKEEQLDVITANGDTIDRLIEEIIPVDREEEQIIKLLENIDYGSSVIRLDLSDIRNNNYVVDLLFYDTPIRPEYKYKYETWNGNDALNNPKYIRYNVKIDGDRIEILNRYEIMPGDYLGEKEQYIGIIEGKSISIYNKYLQEEEEYIFDIIKYINQPNTEIINSIIEKEIINRIKKYIEESIDIVESGRYKHNKGATYKKLKRRAVATRTVMKADDYIIIEIRNDVHDDNEYLVIDIKDNRSVQYRKICVEGNYRVLEVEGKIYIFHNSYNEKSFVKYDVISQNDKEIDIRIYEKDRNMTYRININKRTIEEI